MAEETNQMGVEELKDVLVLVRDAAKELKVLFGSGQVSFNDVLDLVLALLVQLKNAVEGFEKIDDEMADLIESEFRELMDEVGIDLLWGALSVALKRGSKDA